ncbi:hypothetical protein [Streptomyces sp. NPDC051561]|uniref:hypothetical protein n=1 Tax=Streptomyces sp. NPDC051561 TaxID=3365658 RepID=UPI0037A04B21
MRRPQDVISRPRKPSHDTGSAPEAPPAATPPTPTVAVGVSQAEAALVEHYPRLVRLAYLVLPPHLGRNRRVLTAHSLVQRSLPRGRTGRTHEAVAGMPLPRRAEDTPSRESAGPCAPESAGPASPESAGPSARDRGHAFVRQQVLRRALEAEPPLLRRAWPKRAQLPPLLPQVWGVRLFPKSGGADELALDQRLAALSGAGRAAYVLRGLERLEDAEVRRVLTASGVLDPGAALAEAATVEPSPLLESAEFDPCSLQARPTDLMRRRHYTRAGAAALAALAVGAVVLGGSADSGSGPLYAQNLAAEHALDPARLTIAPAAAWKSSDRTDFSVWPVRGALADDSELLRRALAAWARPGGIAGVSATPGTATGPAMGPPQLLYAGKIEGARVAVLYDGLRLVRYAEPADGSDGAVLDFARVDGALEASANAVVLARTDTHVRYLTAPWADRIAVRDLLDPDSAPRALPRDPDGVTGPVAASSMARACTGWDAMEVRDSTGTRTLTDLGELLPARLTAGAPGAPADLKSEADRTAWARTACLLPTLRSHGVRNVNSWSYASQQLPEGNGTAQWLCTRAETWRGGGSRVFAQFQPPSTTKSATGAVAAKAEDSAACGPKDPKVLAGVLWKSKAGASYLLAAGDGSFSSLAVSGGVNTTSDSRLLAVPAKDATRAVLTGRLEGGAKAEALH